MPRRNHPTRPRQKQRQHFRNLATAHQVGRPGGLFCPCGKMSANSEDEAWEIALSIHAARGGERPQRVYSCNDDGLPPFHWTRRP